MVVQTWQHLDHTLFFAVTYIDRPYEIIKRNHILCTSLSLPQFFFFPLFYVYGHFACIYVCSPGSPEDGIRSPGTEAMDRTVVSCHVGAEN